MSSRISFTKSEVLTAFQTDIFPEYRTEYQNILTELFAEATASIDQFPFLDNEELISRSFSQLEQKSVSLKMISTKNAQQFSLLNRYPDVIPFDYNCVRFSQISANMYFNASWMTAAKQQYILTQGPIRTDNGMLDTISTFWATAIDKKCRLIVNLVPENEIPSRCSDYWSEDYWEDQGSILVPESEKINLGRSGEYTEVMNVEWFLENQESVEDNEDFVVRRYQLKTDNDETREIHQIHFKKWQDKDAPDFSAFQKLISCIERYNSMEFEASPIMVHCSAGIGRTGTLIAAHSLMRRIDKQRENFLSKALCVNILETVMGIRMAREGSVMTPSQLKTIVQFLNSHIQSMLI